MQGRYGQAVSNVRRLPTTIVRPYALRQSSSLGRLVQKGVWQRARTQSEQQRSRKSGVNAVLRLCESTKILLSCRYQLGNSQSGERRSEEATGGD